MFEVLAKLRMAVVRRPISVASAGLLAFGGVIGVAVSSAVVGGGATVDLASGERGSAQRQASLAVGHVAETRILQDNDWIQSLQSGRYYRQQARRRGTQSAAIGSRWNLDQRSRLGRLEPEPDAQPRGRRSVTTPRASSETYRTVCVRLCDGYYFPISPSTTKGRFNSDAKACASACAAPTRLYYHRAAGDASEMVDRRGGKYINLQTAFLYRTSHNAACKCRPDPWEKEARDQHRIYALQAERRKIRGRTRQSRNERRELARQINDLRKGIRAASRQEKRDQKKVTRSVMAATDDNARAARVDQFVTESSEGDQRSVATR
jgi:hypothetical protein